MPQNKDTRYGITYVEHEHEKINWDKQKQKEYDIRKANFRLGNDADKLQSINKTSYAQPNGFQPSQLSQQTKAELRQHNFDLGNDKVCRDTDYTANYTKKVAGQAAVMDNGLRSHNHQFGNNKNNFETSYNHNFKEYPIDSLHQAKSKDQIMDQVVELRKTNIINDKSAPFESTHNHEYYDKGYQKRPPMPVKNSNLNLGSDQDIYSTVHSQTYQNRFQAPDPLNKDLVRDLRKEHFQLGNNGNNYISEAKGNYMGFTNNAANILNPKLQQGNFKLGDGKKNYDQYISNYNNNYKGEGGEKRDIINPQADPNSVNVCLGSGDDNEPYTTEHMSSFIPLPNAKRNLNQAQLDDLRKHHQQLGIDKDEYKTQYQAELTDKFKDLDPAYLEGALKNDLRKEHFQLGHQGNHYTTSNKLDDVKGNPAVLNDDLLKDLRSHHQTKADCNQDYKTTYQRFHLLRE